MKNKLFVPFEIAKELSELKFDMPCLAIYDNTENVIMCFQSGEDYDINFADYTKTLEYDFCYLTPLYQQVIDWLFDKHKITIQQQVTLDSNGDWYYFTITHNRKMNICEGDFDVNIAKKIAILKSINIIKNKKK